MPTQPALVHYGSWDEETRKNPALRWFEPVVKGMFDQHIWETPYNHCYTDDMTLRRPDGSEVVGGKAAWADVAQTYGRFTAQHTQPYFMVTTETEYGWEMIGNMCIFANLPGEPAPGEQKAKDDEGREWDIRTVGGFRFQFVKDAGGPTEDGILMRLIEVMTDTAPLMMRLVARGVMKPSDLGL